MSVIQANSSISVTPGSETLWSVQSGQYWGMRRLASSTRSWKVRGSTRGGSIATLLLPRDDVERVDEAALGAGRLDPVADVDHEGGDVLGVGDHPDVDHLDARLPPGQGVADLRLDQAVGGRVVRREDEIVDAAAEVGAHAPLSLGGREDQLDR